MSEVLKKVPTDEVVETLYNDLRRRVEAVEPNDSMVAPDYADLTLPILVGTRCTHNRGLYKCNTQINSSEAWDSTHWDEITVGSELDNLQSNVSGKTDQGAVATPYGSLTWPVTAGQYCFQNGYVYRAKQDIATSESWTAAHWDQVVLGDEVCRAMNAIEGVDQSSAKVINAKKSRRPIMTFIDDDSCIEFASIWPAICEEKGIKVNCAVISDSVGDSSHLSWSQIEQMHNDGIVEFVNHTDAQENLTGIDPEEAYTRVKKCKDALASHGIKTGDILVYPYGAYDETAIDAFKGICRCGITTDKGSEITWNEPTIRTFALWRNELVETTTSTNPSLSWMKSVVDAAVEHNAWVIWMSHSQYAGFDADEIANIKSLIDYATEKDVDIVTVSEALDLYANAFEIGRYQHNGRANGLVIGCDGTTYGKGANFVEEHNTYLFHTPAKEFPVNNIIASFITGSDGVGLLNDGVMLSVIAPTTQSEFTADSFQIYKQKNDGKLFFRGFASDGLPNDFMLITPSSGITANRPKNVERGYCYFDTTLGKPVFASKTTQRAWYKLTITAGTTGAGTTKFSGASVALEAGLTKQEVRNVVATALCPLRTTSPTPGLIYYTPNELGLTDDGVSLYCMRSAFVDYTMDLWVDPVAPDTGCRGTYTRIRDGVAVSWVDATGTAV